MKRILLVLTVALVMATMVLAMAVPAMAKTLGSGPGEPVSSGDGGEHGAVHCNPLFGEDVRGVLTTSGGGGNNCETGPPAGGGIKLRTGLTAFVKNIDPMAVCKHSGLGNL